MAEHANHVSHSIQLPYESTVLSDKAFNTTTSRLVRGHALACSTSLVQVYEWGLNEKLSFIVNHKVTHNFHTFTFILHYRTSSIVHFDQNLHWLYHHEAVTVDPPQSRLRSRPHRWVHWSILHMKLTLCQSPLSTLSARRIERMKTWEFSNSEPPHNMTQSCGYHRQAQGVRLLQHPEGSMEDSLSSLYTWRSLKHYKSVKVYAKTWSQWLKGNTTTATAAAASIYSNTTKRCYYTMPMHYIVE